MPTLGTIDWDAVAAAIARNHYDGVLMLEVFHPLDELKQMLDNGMAETLANFLAAARGESA
jgi:sugar phosphate isomerase/epimerase